MSYVATINVPGYLPMDVDPPIFETAREAWEYLASEYVCDSDYAPDPYAYEPDDPSDPQGPHHQSGVLWELEARAQGIDELGRCWRSAREGTVYGPTPGYYGNHDLGLAYCVTWTDEELPID